MTKLLEIKAKIIQIFEKNESYILPVIRFILAVTVFLMINTNLGYMQRIDNIFVVLILAVICSVLPLNATVIVSALLLLLHLYALSVEVCIVALFLMILTFFLYFRFSPKSGYQAILMPVLFQIKIPYFMPVKAGLTGTPYSVLSVLCGTVLYYFLKGVVINEKIFMATTSTGGTSKFMVAINQIFSDKEMFLVLAAFAFTAVVVYAFRKMSIDHAWSIAISVGLVVQFLILLVGKFLYGNVKDIIWMVVGMILSSILSFGIEFFLFHLDYTRTERVQFEDDTYYYYVKAVPKALVQTREKKITRINKRGDEEQERLTKDSIAEELEINRDLLN